MDGDKVLGENIKKNTDECIRVIEEAMFDIKLGDANEIENFQDDWIMQKEVWSGMKKYKDFKEYMEDHYLDEIMEAISPVVIRHIRLRKDVFLWKV